MENGVCSTDTFIKFLNNYNLVPVIKGDTEKNKLASLSGKDGKIEGKLDVTLNNDKKLIAKLNNLITGRNFGELEIPEEKLANAILSYGGLKLSDTKGGIAKLKFQSRPRKESKIDIVFEGGFELTEIPVKIFSSAYGAKFELDLKNAVLSVSLDWNSYTPTSRNTAAKVIITFAHHQIYTKTKDEIEIHKFLKNLASGKSFTIHAESGETFSNKLECEEDLSNEATIFLDYFEKLKNIEQNYGIRFTDINIKELTDASYNTVKKIVSAINNQPVIKDWHDELIMEVTDFSDENLRRISQINKEQVPTYLHYRTEEKVELHGKEIAIGYQKIEIPDPYISNLDDLLLKTTNLAKVTSKSKKIRITYTKEPEIE